MIENNPRRVKTLAALVLVATFIAGAVAGAGTSRAFAGPPFPPFGRGGPFGGPPGPPPIDKISRELDLTPEQEEQVKKIFADNQPRIAEVMKDTFPRIRAVVDDIQGQI